MGKRPRSMKTRILFLVALSFLSGCASSNLYWGPALIAYGSGNAETFASGASRNAAEYDTARKKLRHSLGQTTTDEGSEAEEIEEAKVNASSKIGIP
jgi:hypothetical protein